MNPTKTTDSHSLQNALGHLESIRDLMSRLRAAEEAGDDSLADEIRCEVTDASLSVEFRSDWNAVGTLGKYVEMTEYRILLSTGGPACQITGTLGAHGEPETAILEHQGWGTPWTEVHGSELGAHGNVDNVDSDLLAFARLFYFGE